VFDRSIPRQEADGSTTPNFIDLYKRGAFICETKQGVEVGRVSPSAPSGDQVIQEPSPSSSGAHGVTRPTRRKTGHGIRGSGTWDNSSYSA